jgi:hypothetical protein
MAEQDMGLLISFFAHTFIFFLRPIDSPLGELSPAGYPRVKKGTPDELERGESALERIVLLVLPGTYFEWVHCYAHASIVQVFENEPRRQQIIFERQAEEREPTKQTMGYSMAPL